MNHPAWGLVTLGLTIVGTGVAWLLSPSIPWLGKLPGDIVLQWQKFSVYFPVVTCLLLSSLLTGILWLVRFFSR